jgi:molybdopterin-guanine dinucleotide biosynthesis protein MobB
VVQVVGDSNSGKTTLIERLIPRLRVRGLRVGTVKHAHHGFDMDYRGKDSWRHAQAGADAVAVVSPRGAAWLIQTEEELSTKRVLEPLADCVDLILVEGFTREAYASKIVLERGAVARLEVEDSRCRVGVPPDELMPDEMERIVQFCVRAVDEELPCRPR